MDTEVVDRILDSVLGLIDLDKNGSIIPAMVYEPVTLVNPVGSIVNSEKELQVMANDIKQLKAAQSEVLTKVTEVHIRLTNNLGKKEIPLTKKQRAELELEEKIEAAHLRVRANGYQR